MRQLQFPFKPTILQCSAVFLFFLSAYITPEVACAIQVILLLIFVRKIQLSKKVLLIGVLLLIHGTINIFLGNVTVVLFAKQLIGISVSFIFYYTIVKRGFMPMIKFYLFLAVVVSLIAIMQQLAYFANILVLCDLRWLVPGQQSPYGGGVLGCRAAAIFAEPSACATFLLPSVFLSIYHFIGRYNHLTCEFLSRRVSILLISGLLVTFSSVGYLGLLAALGVIFLEYKHTLKQVGVLVVALAAVVGLYCNINVFKMRVDDTLNILFTGNFQNVNLSSQTIYLNAIVAWESFLNTFGFGGGLGSHGISYQKYVTSVNATGVNLFLNQTDANSLFSRVLSELGLIGLISVFYFLFKFYARRCNSIYFVINKMCLPVFAIRLIRRGHYFNEGIWFFVVLYYFSCKEVEKYLQNRNLDDNTKNGLKPKV